MLEMSYTFFMLCEPGKGNIGTEQMYPTLAKRKISKPQKHKEWQLFVKCSLWAKLLMYIVLLKLHSNLLKKYYFPHSIDKETEA